MVSGRSGLSVTEARGDKETGGDRRGREGNRWDWTGEKGTGQDGRGWKRERGGGKMYYTKGKEREGKMRGKAI